MAAAAAALASGLPRDAVAEGLRSFPGVRHRLERVRERERRALGQRLEGDQRGLRAGGDPGVRRRRPADRGWAAEAGELRASRPGGRRALRRLLPDRRGGGAHGRRARAGGRGRRRDLGGRHAGAGRRGRGGARPSRARSSCSPRPARASMPSRTSRSAGTAFASWSRPCREQVDARARESATRERWEAGGAATRVLAAADGDALPARLRRGDGVQRQLGPLAAQPRRQRLLLPGAHPAVRGDRTGGDADRRSSRGRGGQGPHSADPGRLAVLPASRCCCPGSAIR